MIEYLTLFALILLLTSIFAILVASTDVQDIKNNWDKRRCETLVLFAGSLFKDAYDKRTSTEFAQDNFQFCIRVMADEVIKAAFAPLYAIAGQQMGAQSTLAGPMNSIRAMIAQGMKTFSSLLDEQYRQYKATHVHVTKTWHHIRFAMGRIGGIVTSILYLGLTAAVLVQNTMKFIIIVILIFIGIMAAMSLLIWFKIIPVLGIIIIMIALLASADAQTGGWISGGNADAGPFCVDPEALVRMADGSYTSLKNIIINDKLFEGAVVTGVLVVDGSKETIVSIDGVRMSTSHRVLHDSKWILAKDHPEAIPSDDLSILICLNTTTHSVPIKGNNGIVYVSDWEEISFSEEKNNWIKWVNQMLNGDKNDKFRYPTSVPLFSPSVKVSTDEGLVESSSIKLGDKILTSGGYTKVVGIYSGQLMSDKPKNPEWISDGLWIKSKSIWITRETDINDNSGENMLRGLCFITEKGSFYIHAGQNIYHVRDFTEVGPDEIAESYSWLDDSINKKV